jgi:hypothetical protein
MYRIIYLWRGERHVHLTQPNTQSEAAALVAEFRADGWQAWYESI